jgi:glycosyltransferase involved in cell wall biosynthesis
MNILIVAQNASSDSGGEAFLPLKYFEILRERGHNVHLIVHNRNRDNLQAYFGSDLSSIHFTEDSAIHRAIWRMGTRFSSTIQDTVFGTALSLIDEVFQTRLIRELINKVPVDVIHQPIPVSPKAVSSIHSSRFPVVIGPMNGGMNYPPGFEDYQSRSHRLFVKTTRELARGLHWLVPGKRRADILLVANARTRDALPAVRRPKIIELVENGVDTTIWHPAPPRRADGAFRLVFVGRLVRWKAVDITIEAIRLARERGADVTLSVVGDGDERGELEAQVDAANLKDVVQFHGFVSQHACAETLRNSDAMILNSIYECGGAVVLEAMSLGLPVIGADWGGPADYLDASCGILVSPLPRQGFEARLADAITELANDPERRRSLGQAGLAKIQAKYDWHKKVDRMLDIYAEAIEIRNRGQGRTV